MSGYSQGVTSVFFKAWFGIFTTHDESPVSPMCPCVLCLWFMTPVLSNARWQDVGPFPRSYNTTNMLFSGGKKIIVLTAVLLLSRIQKKITCTHERLTAIGKCSFEFPNLKYPTGFTELCLNHSIFPFWLPSCPCKDRGNSTVNFSIQTWLGFLSKLCLWQCSVSTSPLQIPAHPGRASPHEIQNPARSHLIFFEVFVFKERFAFEGLLMLLQC